MNKQEQSAFNDLVEVCQDALANADMEHNPDESLPNYVAMSLAVTSAEQMARDEQVSLDNRNGLIQHELRCICTIATSSAANRANDIKYHVSCIGKLLEAKP